MIKLGNKIRCKLRNIEGYAYSVETHAYGCTTVDLMPKGAESLSKSTNISTTVLEVIDKGFEDQVNQAIKPRYENFDNVRTLNGIEGVICVVLKSISGRVIYAIQEPSTDGVTLKDAVFVDEELVVEKLEKSVA